MLKRNFRPEFLNRLDEIVFYKPLSKDEISEIVNLMIDDIKDRLKEKQLDFYLTEDAKKYVIDGGFDPIYGARPLRRFLQTKVETLLARKIISSDLSLGDCLVVDYDGNELFIRQ